MSALARRSIADLRAERAQIAAGDLIRTGDNFHPHYLVIAIAGDRAWIRDTQYGTDHVMPVERCTRIEKARSSRCS